MMNNCKGLIGKIFGHCFRMFLLRERVRGITEASGKESIKEILPYLTDYYEIRCKRCGAKPKDEE